MAGALALRSGRRRSRACILRPMSFKVATRAANWLAEVLIFLGLGVGSSALCALVWGVLWCTFEHLVNRFGVRMSIFLRLREERERLGFSQEAFGVLGGVQKRAQINYEKGERHPDSAYLAAIAAAGADVLYILTGQRAGGASAPPPPRAVSEGDRILLDNFHAAPAQVQAGVKTALGAFAPGGSPRRGKQDKAA